MRRMPKVPTKEALDRLPLERIEPRRRAEVERLCSQHAGWNKAKTALESTFGLIEDACKQPATEIEGDMQLDANRRQELETLRSDKLSETAEQSEQETETEERPLAFKPAVWAPLAAAACAAFLVWASDSTDRETPEEKLAAADLKPAEKVEENENLPAMPKKNATLRTADRGLAKKRGCHGCPKSFRRNQRIPPAGKSGCTCSGRTGSSK